MQLILAQKTIQQVAEATSAVLGLGVTVLDRNLRRIAGTGPYRELVGSVADKASSFGEVLVEGRTVIVNKAAQHPACRTCPQRLECTERAHICTPIKVDGEVFGVFGIIAWTEKEREQLLKGQAGYARFIEKMAELISYRISEQKIQEQLQDALHQLEEIVNAVQDGLLSVDCEGKLITANRVARDLLALTAEESKLPAKLPIFQTLQNGKPIHNKEVKLETGGAKVHVMMSCFPVKREQTLIGAVATVKDYRDVKKMVNRLVTNQATYTFEDIQGRSPALVRVKELALKAAAQDSTVLIQGESGTGKELFAQAICNAGPRAGKPFVAINCGGIPDGMLESELFGYEGGAFTGARREGKPGRLELADGGTVFLDEIGELPLRLQVKLLRVLQSGTISRLGSTKVSTIDVRVIAATNRDLEDMVSKKEFREDLFYRLSVIPIQLPPLRERKEDIGILLDFFIDKYNQEFNKKIKGIEPEAMAFLQSYHWPGNVRELENTLEFAVSMAGGEYLTMADLPARIKKAASPGVQLKPLAIVETELIRKGLELYGNSDQGKIRIAQELGISRSSIYRKIKKYGLG